ncbi:MAG: hypothetical protein V3V51_06535 [Desulfobacterales bacterium]
MSPFRFIHNIFLKRGTPGRDATILRMKEQIKAWRRANQMMGWGIPNNEFEMLSASLPPPLTDNDRMRGFIGSVLFYGFGEDERGNADAVLSGKLAWEYATKRKRGKTWQCEYVNFNKPEDIRLRPGAPARPKGFYYAKIQPGKRFKAMTVSQLRKKLAPDTGWGPEGFQFLSITHSHFADLMNERKIPFMALADYDVAPHGFNDFFDAPQLFCSNNKLGLGIGNVDRNYPLFGIPTLRFAYECEAYSH